MLVAKTQSALAYLRIQFLTLTDCLIDRFEVRAAFPQPACLSSPGAPCGRRSLQICRLRSIRNFDFGAALYRYTKKRTTPRQSQGAPLREPFRPCPRTESDRLCGQAGYRAWQLFRALAGLSVQACLVRGLVVRIHCRFTRRFDRTTFRRMCSEAHWSGALFFSCASDRPSQVLETVGEYACRGDGQ